MSSETSAAPEKGGSASWHGSLLRRWARRLGLAVAILFGVGGATAGVIAWLLGPIPLAAVSETSRLVLDRNGQLLRPYTIADGRWRLPAAVSDVDPRYLAMLFAFEDRRFYKHGGVDFRAVGRALWQLAEHGRPVSGASTLTMQTARLLDGTPTHSIFAKLQQIVRAYELEWSLSKQDILEIYLKLAPYGGNIEGVRAASLAYFGKEPRRLSVDEAALLVALPQSPEARRPDRNGEAAKRARNLVLDRAEASGVISAAEAAWAKQQPISVERHAFPALAAHLADRLIAEFPQEPVICTTLDKSLQEAAEALTARQAQILGPKLSTAIIAADHKTGEVLAAAGSAGYFDEARQGSIDMTRAVRSPGSALKPFVYGLAFEDGFALPQTLIEDRPVRFGVYAPENFDNTYRGTVTVAQALQWSLNVPAVKLLAAISPARLSARFRQAGFNIEVPRNLSVVLGGVGLTLEDLAGLYAALARGGEPIALRYTTLPPGENFSSPLKSQPLLSPLAAWYVTDILRGSPPPASAPPGAIAFKTGTSYGYRDAWAAGYDGRYIVAAWAGRPDASPTPGLMGIKGAAPMVFDMFAKLSPQRVPFDGPPAPAITGPTASLPPPLMHFREPGAQMADAGTAAEPALRIAFPPNNAEIELTRDGTGAALPVALKAEGGALPLTWLIDGTPVASEPYRRQVFWSPNGKGFAQLTVIDAKGRSERVSIRIR